MKRRWRGTCAALAALALAASVSGQKTSSSTSLRTSWGDPDLQGYYTNKYEYGTPFERPAAFEGRSIEEVTASELASSPRSARWSDRARSVLRRRSGRANRQLGGVQGYLRGCEGLAPLARDRPSRRPNSTDPARGARPREGGGCPERELRSGTIQGPERFHAVGALHHPRYSGLDAAGRLRQLLSDRAVARLRRDPLRDGARDPRDTGRRTSASRRRSDPIWAMRAAAGTARRSSSKRRTFCSAAHFAAPTPTTLRLVERFTRTSPTALEWAVTVDDSSTWASLGRSRCRYAEREEAVKLYECHEGNHAIFNVLSAARATERGRTVR